MNEPQQFRKKPVVIEAMQMLTRADGLEIAEWCGGRMRSDAKASDPTDEHVYMEIPTLEGVMRAEPGDYVIRGVKGEFYPCKPEIFDATYEPADPRPSTT